MDPFAEFLIHKIVVALVSVTLDPLFWIGAVIVALALRPGRRLRPALFWAAGFTVFNALLRIDDYRGDGGGTAWLFDAGFVLVVAAGWTWVVCALAARWRARRVNQS